LTVKLPKLTDQKKWRKNSIYSFAILEKILAANCVDKPCDNFRKYSSDRVQSSVFLHPTIPTEISSITLKLNPHKDSGPNEEVGTSAPPHHAPVRNRNFGAELIVRNRLKKKVQNGGFGTTENNFRTSSPTEDYFHLNSNIVPRSATRIFLREELENEKFL